MWQLRFHWCLVLSMANFIIIWRYWPRVHLLQFLFLGFVLVTGVMTLLSVVGSYITTYMITGKRTLNSSNPYLRSELLCIDLKPNALPATFVSHCHWHILPYVFIRIWSCSLEAVIDTDNIFHMDLSTNDNYHCHLLESGAWLIYLVIQMYHMVNPNIEIALQIWTHKTKNLIL